MLTQSKFFADLRPAARDLPESGIVELVNAGRLKEGLIPLWVGEGHLPTPPFICNAATRAMAAGETFYTWQRGIPPLRKALADYHAALFDQPFDAENFFITGSGMQAVQIVMAALAGKGDEVVIPSPSWPNFASCAKIAGAVPVEVPMAFKPDDAWVVDMDAIEAAITPKTRILFVNSPSNPTGWTASHDELKAFLDIARRHDIWLVADEVYTRFFYDAPRAPSFHDVMSPDDKIIFVNTFSKNWAMTGWRIGWIEAPRELGQVFENLIQFSTSGVATFMQFAALTALKEGHPFIEEQVAAARESRDVICDALSATQKVSFVKPEGAFYLFFEMNGISDSRETALRLIDEAGVGLAPGSAFGLGAEKGFRLCFARKPEHIQEAGDRLTRWLIRNI